MPIIGWMCVQCGEWTEECQCDDETDENVVDLSSGLQADDSGYGG